MSDGDNLTCGEFMALFEALPRHCQQQFVDHFLQKADPGLRKMAAALERWMAQQSSA